MSENISKEAYYDEMSKKLKALIITEYGTVKRFAEVSNIPASTLTSSFSRGIANMPIERMIKICDILDVDVKTLEPRKKVEPKSVILSEKEDRLIRSFGALTDKNQTKVFEYINLLLESQLFRNEK